MKSGIKHSGQLNHLKRTGHDTGFPPEPRKPMALWRIVAFNQVRLALALNQQLRRD